MNKWNIAANALREAASIIEQRSALRDDPSGRDLLCDAAELSGLSAETILSSMLAIKEARWRRAGDWDSAVDFLAYQARYFANGARVNP